MKTNVQRTASHCLEAFDATYLKKLHWLPIKFRIIFKVATIMHNTLHNRSPPYLKDLVTFSVSGPQRRQLRSTTTRSAVVLRTIELNLVVALSQSADQTFGTASLST